MIKKAIAVLLAAVLVFALTGCGSVKAEPLDVPGKKVVILTAPEEQYPEYYREAYRLAEKYPDTVSVREYGDSRILKGGTPEIILLSEEIASDKNTGAIIYAGAPQFADSAAKKAKEVNEKIVISAVEPECSYLDLTKSADLILCVDWEACADDIVKAARAQDARYFLFFSFPRHVDENAHYLRLMDYIERKCGESGIEFMKFTSTDPTYSGGISEAKRSVSDQIAGLYDDMKIRTEDVAVFSTDSSVQTALIEEANSRGLIYICPSFPSAYNGLGEVYKSEGDDYFKGIKDAVTADPEGKGRFFIYSYSLVSVLLDTVTRCTFDMLTGKTSEENFDEKVPLRAKEAADDGKFICEKYTVSTKAFQCYKSSFEYIKKK